MTLLEFLNNRLSQLEDRKFMIPKYLKRSGSFIGKKDFSMDDLPKIEHQIKETEAAISAVKEFNKKQSKNH